MAKKLYEAYKYKFVQKYTSERKYKDVVKLLIINHIKYGKLNKKIGNKL